MDQDEEIEQKQAAATKRKEERSKQKKNRKAVVAGGWTNQRVYIFSEVLKEEVLKLELHVCAVNSTSLLAVTKYDLRHCYDMGYVALGSKLYSIGGDHRHSDCGYSWS
ncbi:hypothetical protein RHMOL_Rhmol06G0135600 [Rhododendron molle]|uniref:Uncharacterized protein n=1 Tax=Rhododendron molle TaxID=49168 RepID=A0ACC0NC47_RHOML|nr:hypothetical protein RHMOL_Rhmol06G0135600 [Rhododendron molle]